jgi:hypothetical protein
MSEYQQGSSPRLTDETLSRTSGQETLLRYSYQLAYVAMRWFETLNDASLTVISEAHEDADIVEAAVASERVQVKTLDTGGWSAGALRPILQRFADQYRVDTNLTFRFVTNAPPSPQVSHFVTALQAHRSGNNLTAQQAQALKTIRDAVKGKLADPGQVDEFVRRLYLDFHFHGLASISISVREQIAILAHDRYGATMAPQDVAAFQQRLSGIVLERSSSRGLYNRILTHDELDELFREATSLVSFKDVPNLATLPQKVAELVERLSQETKEEAPEEAPFTEGDAQRVVELRASLAEPRHPLLEAARLRDRMELARLLWDKGDTAEAEMQCVEALAESMNDAGALLYIVHDCANFLAGRHPESTILLPYLERYFELLTRDVEVAWRDGLETFLYITAAHGEQAQRPYLEELIAHISGQDVDELSPVQQLRWHEAMFLGQIFAGDRDEGISHFRALLESVDVFPAYDHEWLRRVFMMVEPHLRDSPEFDELLRAFSEFYEAKESWGHRADLYKDLGMRRFEAEEYELAIPCFRVSSEGYLRVREYRGSLLSRMMLALCFERNGRTLASLREYLAAAKQADLSGTRDLVIQALQGAIQVGFNNGYRLEGMLWTITLCRLSGVIGTEDDLTQALVNLEAGYALMSVHGPKEHFDLLREIVQKAVPPDEIQMLNLLEACANASDSDWATIIEKEEPELRDSFNNLRPALRAQVSEAREVFASTSIQVGGLTVVADWSREPRLKWLALGVLSWFEFFGESLTTFIDDLDSRFEIHIASFDDADWAEKAYEEEVGRITSRTGCTALAAQTPDGHLRLIVLMPRHVYDATDYELGKAEFEALFVGIAMLRAYRNGDPPVETMKRFGDDFLEPNSFDVRMERLASSEHDLGGFMRGT